MGKADFPVVVSPTFMRRNELEGEVEALRARLAEAERAHDAYWRPINTAPKTGPATDILLAVPDRAGCRGVLVGHWAYGGGEDQPPFGPAWFFWTGYDFRELRCAPTHWMPLPEPPHSAVTEEPKA